MIPSFGLFTVSLNDKILTINSWTKNLIEIDYGGDPTDISVQDFLILLGSMTEDPALLELKQR